MTASPFPRIERYVRAICRPGAVVCAGRRAVRIGARNKGNPSQNLPVKIVVYGCESAAVPTLYSSQAGSGNWPARVLRINPILRASRWPLSRRHSRDLARRVWNLFGPFQAARRFLCAPLKFCQEPSCRAAYRLKSFSSAVLHGANHGANDVGKISFSVGEVRNVER